MPSVSKKQHNLMAMVANNPKAAKRLGIKQSVGKEFIQTDKGKKFGGSKMADKQDPRDANIFTADKGIKPPKNDDMGSIQKKSCGGKVKKMASGGKVRGCGCATKGKTKGRMV